MPLRPLVKRCCSARLGSEAVESLILGLPAPLGYQGTKFFPRPLERLLKALKD